MHRVTSLLRAIDRALMRAEVALVTAALLLMVVLKFADVVMRNTGHGGIPAFATAAQHLVIWAGMLGASLATADRKHIAIEVLSPLVSGRARRAVEASVNGATALLCGFLAYVAWRWLEFLEIPDTSTLFAIPWIEVPFRRWWSLTIIPIGFALIGFRFLRLALERALGVEAGGREEEMRREIEEYERRHSSDERPAAGAGSGTGTGDR